MIRRQLRLGRVDDAAEACRIIDALADGARACAPMNVTGNYVIVWSRGADGEWRIQRFTAADFMMADAGEASAL